MFITVIHVALLLLIIFLVGIFLGFLAKKLISKWGGRSDTGHSRSDHVSVSPPSSPEPEKSGRTSHSKSDPVSDSSETSPVQTLMETEENREEESEPILTAEEPSVTPSSPDDLKKIKGIGKVIEQKLHTMDITTYKQIAAWNEADIEAVDGKLNFKGRIQREGWIEQAKDLSQ